MHTMRRGGAAPPADDRAGAKASSHGRASETPAAWRKRRRELFMTSPPRRRPTPSPDNCPVSACPRPTKFPISPRRARSYWIENTPGEEHGVRLPVPNEEHEGMIRLEDLRFRRRTSYAHASDHHDG